MLRNLLPDFLAVLDSEDRVAAYRRYFEAHRPLLAAYWDNYVVDPDGPHVDEVVRATVSAERDDLHALLARVDLGGQGDHVHPLEHRAQVVAVGGDGGGDDVGEVRALRVDDVVLPVRLEQRAVGVEVAAVGGGAVGARENGEEVGEQIDQHLDRRRRAHRRPSAQLGAVRSGRGREGEKGRGKLAAARKANK